MSDFFMGEVTILPYNFSVRNFALCSGATVPINQNSALFAIIGTIYGGDGRSTFDLPNLTQRAPMHAGIAPGLTPYYTGNFGGYSGVTLASSEIPEHSHDLVAVQGGAASLTDSATGNLLSTARTASGATYPYKKPPLGTLDDDLNSNSIGSSGQNNPHENRQPYLAVQFQICINGTFPPRN